MYLSDASSIFDMIYRRMSAEGCQAELFGSAPEREDIYEMIYALLTAKGWEEALFGSRKEAARRAFGRSLVGTAFPELWFELPLWGEPWFDLHVLTVKESLKADEVAGSNLPEEVKPLFRWFAGAEAVRELALSWDVGKDDNPSPAV